MILILIAELVFIGSQKDIPDHSLFFLRSLLFIILTVQYLLNCISLYQLKLLPSESHIDIDPVQIFI